MENKPITPEQRTRLTQESVEISKRIGDLLAQVMKEAPPGHDKAELLAELAAGAMAASCMLTQLAGMPSPEAATQYAEGVRVCKGVPPGYALGQTFEDAFRALLEAAKAESLN